LSLLVKWSVNCVPLSVNSLVILDGMVVCHPYVVAEVACGTPPSRKVIITMLGELESTPVATQTELLAMLNARQLYGCGRGCGFVDK
jgi:hypothetical protein